VENDFPKKLFITIVNLPRAKRGRGRIFVRATLVKSQVFPVKIYSFYWGFILDLNKVLMEISKVVQIEHPETQQGILHNGRQSESHNNLDTIFCHVCYSRHRLQGGFALLCKSFP